jgi:hypothetical protein
MAVYYVRPDGNDVNTGLGSGTGQAWKTLTKALGASGITGGDTLYIAPGLYNEALTLGGTYSSTTNIIGNPSANQFSGVTPGFVKISAFNSAGSITNSSYVILASSKSNLNFSNLYFELSSSLEGLKFTSAQNINFTSCYLEQYATTNNGDIYISSPSSLPINSTISKCIFMTSRTKTGLYLQGQDVSDTTTISDCIFIGGSGQIDAYNIAISVYNCAYLLCGNVPIWIRTTSTTYKSYVYNTYFWGAGYGIYATAANTTIENYNKYTAISSPRTNVPTGANSIGGIFGIEMGQTSLFSLTPVVQTLAPLSGSGNIGVGTTTGAPSVDINGNTWASNIDIGAISTKVLSTLGTYFPAEKNLSYLNVAYGSTSQSLNIYLGGTGISYNSSGLQAYYTRQNSAPVGIGLTWQTPTGTWKSGGLIEVNSSTTPGLYRLDVPNAAFASGASSVTITLKGTFGTNGTFVNVNLTNVQAQLDTTQNLGSTTVGDALNSANSGGVGKWSISGDLLYLYAADGSLTKKLRVKNLRIDV